MAQQSPACADAACGLDAQVTLLYVIDPADIEAVAGPHGRLLGRPATLSTPPSSSR